MIVKTSDGYEIHFSDGSRLEVNEYIPHKQPIQYLIDNPDLTYKIEHPNTLTFVIDHEYI